jgi:hypothetical protein
VAKKAKAPIATSADKTKKAEVPFDTSADVTKKAEVPFDTSANVAFNCSLKKTSLAPGQGLRAYHCLQDP